MNFDLLRHLSLRIFDYMLYALLFLLLKLLLVIKFGRKTYPSLF